MTFIAIALTLFGLDYFLGWFQIPNITTGLILALWYTVLVKVVKPLVRFLSLPMNLFTLGLTSLVINTLLTMVLFLCFNIHFTFLQTIFVSIVICVVSSIVKGVLGD